MSISNAVMPLMSYFHFSCNWIAKHWKTVKGKEKLLLGMRVRAVKSKKFKALQEAQGLSSDTDQRKGIENV